MKVVFTLLCTSLFCLLLPAQQAIIPVPENIVPNPGFEHYSSTPIGWFYKGEHFTQVMKYWNSATAASPDVFGKKVRVPSYWREKGFGDQQPHSGESMVGITVYGCEDGKPHCREYIQIQLREPLVVGQNYSAEFWVSQLPFSLSIDRLGMLLSETPPHQADDGLLEFQPQIKSNRVVQASNNSWIRIADKFTATFPAEYLTIGNFYPDSLTKTQCHFTNHLNYGYYYVDDVLLKKEEPILEVPVSDDDLTRITLEEGKLITLKNIFFDHDKVELLPRSFIELDKLVQLMRENPSMVIQIIGHTDSVGDTDYNLELSERRASAVISYLYQKGIPSHRAFHKGYGSSRPLASNDNATGRQLNRRVELLIVKK